MEKYINKFLISIIVAHPMQYYSMLYRELAKEINLTVFYGVNLCSEQKGADGFGISLQWDIDLVQGYEFEVLDNISKWPINFYILGYDHLDVCETLERYNSTHVANFGWHLKSYPQVLKYYKKKSIPIDVRGVSKIDINESSVKEIIKSIYYSIFLKRYNVLLSVGSKNRKYLMEYHVQENKRICSPRAVYQQFWKGKSAAHYKYTFIWLGKFISLKISFGIIDLFKILDKSNQNIQLKMTGTGIMLDAAIQRASSCTGIPFLGFKNQLKLRKEYLSSDAAVLTSDLETPGLVVNEAFAIGLNAIVSSKVGSSGGVIKPNTGIVYNESNVNILSEWMMKLCA